MKLVRCSHCQTEAALLQFGDMPLGWITLKQAGRPDEQHYCGRRCAATALVEQVETEHAETLVASPLPTLSLKPVNRPWTADEILAREG